MSPITLLCKRIHPDVLEEVCKVRLARSVVNGKRLPFGARDLLQHSGRRGTCAGHSGPDEGLRWRALEMCGRESCFTATVPGSDTPNNRSENSARGVGEEDRGKRESRPLLQTQRTGPHHPHRDWSWVDFLCPPLVLTTRWAASWGRLKQEARRQMRRQTMIKYERHRKRWRALVYKTETV